MITWTPIAQLPDELKDGRDVLLWLAPDDGPVVGNWLDDERWHVELFSSGADEATLSAGDATHFAEITPP